MKNILIVLFFLFELASCALFGDKKISSNDYSDYDMIILIPIETKTDPEKTVRDYYLNLGLSRDEILFIDSLDSCRDTLDEILREDPEYFFYEISEDLILIEMSLIIFLSEKERGTPEEELMFPLPYIVTKYRDFIRDCGCDGEAYKHNKRYRKS
ncbi:hypothetical protein KC842_01010 [Candidatus Nomurabacteria bacterium]|nr:hypothetical protein [Candidatus Nomurabacteria bacterium]USN94846.1 MAG: hypothetical protein H6791_00215 [Candidatus Nomurabacteria bacterium]